MKPFVSWEKYTVPKETPLGWHYSITALIIRNWLFFCCALNVLVLLRKHCFTYPVQNSRYAWNNSSVCQEVGSLHGTAVVHIPSCRQVFCFFSTHALPELADVIKVTPHLGVLNPHLYKGRLSRQQVEVTFSPK